MLRKRRNQNHPTRAWAALVRRATDENLSLLRATLESTADGILVVDRDGHISTFNQTFVEMWNIPADVVALRDDAAALRGVLSQLRDPTAFLKKVKALYADPEATSFDVIHFKDGRVFERYSRPQFVDGQVVGRVWSFRDVTARVQAEADLRERGALLAQSEQLGNIGSWVWDIQKDVVTWSDQLYRIYGLGIDEFPGSYRGFLERVVPEDRATARQAIEAGFTQAKFEFECRIRRPDGEIRILECRGETVRDSEGTAFRMFGIARDVTEERAQERALRESEERFRRAFEDSGLGMSLATLDGRYLRVNREMCRITGRNQKELLALSFEDVTHPDDVAYSLVGLRAMTSGRLRRWQREKRFLRPDGMVVWAQITTSIVRAADGSPSHFVTQVEDITERRRQDAERRALAEQVRQAQKMEAVARLAGGVAHDFNNLLTAILGNCEMLLEDADLPGSLRAQVGEIREAAGFGENVAAQLLDLSRRRVVRPEVVDLTGLITRMRSLLQRIVGETITLELNVPTSPVHVVGDTGALEQVVLNLAVNARDAMVDGGTFTIELTVVEIAQDKAIEHLGLGVGPLVMLAATDTGVGMEPAVQERVFEPFFTTKEGELATGLGLSTTYQIVSQAGGHISVESVVGEGTTFRIFLPRAGTQVEGLPTGAEVSA